MPTTLNNQQPAHNRPAVQSCPVLTRSMVGRFVGKNFIDMPQPTVNWAAAVHKFMVSLN